MKEVTTIINAEITGIVRVENENALCDIEAAKEKFIEIVKRCFAADDVKVSSYQRFIRDMED